MFQLALIGGLLAAVVYVFITYPMILLIPALIAAAKLAIGWALHLRDKKRASKRPPLPCEGHKGTWSNPDYFTEDELNNKE